VLSALLSSKDVGKKIFRGEWAKETPRPRNSTNNLSPFYQRRKEHQDREIAPITSLRFIRSVLEGALDMYSGITSI